MSNNIKSTNNNESNTQNIIQNNQSRTSQTVQNNRINKTNNRKQETKEDGRSKTNTIPNNSEQNQKQYYSIFNPKPSTSKILPPNDLNFDDDDDFMMAALEENLNQVKPKVTDVHTISDEDDMFEAMDFDFERNIQPPTVQENVTFPIKVSAEPYIYIKQFVENKDKLINKTVKVKAQFINVVEKLSFNNTSGWRMKFNITDGTAMIVVDFRKEVLEELLGISHEQALQLRQKIKNNVVSAAEKLKEVRYFFLIHIFKHKQLFFVY